MKPGFYILFAILYLVNLANLTLFKGEWNGLTMWLSTGLFIIGTVYYIVSRTDKAKQ